MKVTRKLSVRGSAAGDDCHIRVLRGYREGQPDCTIKLSATERDAEGRHIRTLEGQMEMSYYEANSLALQLLQILHESHAGLLESAKATNQS